MKQALFLLVGLFALQAYSATNSDDVSKLNMLCSMTNVGSKIDCSDPCGMNTGGKSPRVECADNRITHLHLNGLSITGSIPNMWPNNLVLINLGSNKLTGTIPNSGYPAGLTHIFFNNNKLTGQIPNGGYPNTLRFLYLNNNMLTGNVPSNLPNNLAYFYADNNRLTGTIPAKWPNSINRIYLDDNNLSGTVLQLPPNLLQLSLTNNSLDGTLPTLPNKIQLVYLNNCSFTGNIPNEFPSSLMQLFLNYNSLVGNIPSQLPSKLTHLYLDHNMLTGTIPSSWPSTLVHLILEFNMLSGRVPSTWPSTLERIILTSNKITGSIPSSLPNKLQRLSLNINEMTGNIPSKFPNSLEELFLDDNLFNCPLNNYSYVKLNDYGVAKRRCNSNDCLSLPCLGGQTCRNIMNKFGFRQYICEGTPTPTPTAAPIPKIPYTMTISTSNSPGEESDGRISAILVGKQRSSEVFVRNNFERGTLFEQVIMAEDVGEVNCVLFNLAKDDPWTVNYVAIAGKNGKVKGIGGPAKVNANETTSLCEELAPYNLVVKTGNRNFNEVSSRLLVKFFNGQIETIPVTFAKLAKRGSTIMTSVFLSDIGDTWDCLELNRLPMDGWYLKSIKATYKGVTRYFKYEGYTPETLKLCPN